MLYLSQGDGRLVSASTRIHFYIDSAFIISFYLPIMLTDANTVLASIRRNPNYLGDSGVVDRSAWTVGPDGRTEYLVPKESLGTTPSSELQPMVLTGIFLIQNSGFYATADCKFHPDRMAEWQKPMGATAAFRRGDASFIVGAVPQTHPKLRAEHESIVNNFTVICRNVLPRVSQTGCCPAGDDIMDMKFKVSHGYFEDRPEVDTTGNADGAANNDGSDGEVHGQAGDPSSTWEHLDHDVDPPFRIANLMDVVQPACRPLLQEIIPTTQFNPLPAVTARDPDNAIVPANYEPELCGAIAQVSFTLSHKFIQRSNGKVSYFKATVDAITVLERPTTISVSPSKVKNRGLFRRGGPGSDGSGNGGLSGSGKSGSGGSQPPAKRSRRA